VKGSSGGAGDPETAHLAPPKEPMKIALLSDIHANFPALCVALEHASAAGADRVLCAGDLVGGGPHPTEVIRLLMEQRLPAVAGNVDRKVCALASDPKRLRRASHHRKRAPLAWTAKVLGPAELNWMTALPGSLRLSAGGAEILLVHGSPLADTDYIFPSITEPALLAKLGAERPELLACGHSHIPFVRTVAGVLVVNSGSVGRPVDGDPRGSYALVELREGAPPRARIVRFSYPVDSVVADLRKRRVPRAMPEDLVRGVRR